MQGRNEVEEILEQQAWADRNGLDRPFSTLAGGVYLPPAEMLREHELRVYRDWPMEYDKGLPFMPLWCWAAATMAVGFGLGAWAWNNFLGR